MKPGIEENASRILKGIDESLRNRFKEIREQYFNQNTKGYEYEKAVSTFLNNYLGGIFDFHTRVALIDKDLKAFEVFSTGENDFDVVATFKNACPKIVLRVGDTNFIPFDAAAFIIEVKQTLNKENLAKDLEKLGKLISFDCSGRFGISFTGQFSIDRPIKTLLYYESSVAGDTVVKMLLDNVKSWDLLLDFSNDVVIGNAALPIVKANMGADKLLGVFASHSLLNYILLTQSSITLAPVTETMRVFLSLLRSASKKT